MRIAVVAVVALALVLAACGEKEEPEVAAPVTDDAATTSTTETAGGGQGGGGGGQVSPEQEVEDAVIAVIGGDDPAASCSELVTQRYVKSAYGDAKGCRAAVAKQGSFSVEVSAVNVKGSTATAKARPAAGPNKGETIDVKLVEERGAWRVDSARSNAPAGP
jgi:hypothetical protein